MGKTFGILSLKGGVGKTSVVTSLGSAISDFNKRVLLVDANFSAPNLGIHLNIVDPEITLHHVLNGVAHTKEAIYNVGNVDVIPSSLFTKTIINPLKLRDKLNHVKKMYDFIIIDSSPAMNDETLSAMLASDETIIVTTPDIPTLSMTIKAIRTAKQRGIKIDGLILNKVHNKDFELSLDDIEKTAEVPILAVIPHDINVLRALSEFTPYTDYKPKSDGSDEFRRLAATLIGERYEPRRFLKFFKVSPNRQDINRTVFYNSVFK